MFELIVFILQSGILLAAGLVGGYDSRASPVTVWTALANVFTFAGLPKQPVNVRIVASAATGSATFMMLTGISFLTFKAPIRSPVPNPASSRGPVDERGGPHR